MPARSKAPIGAPCWIELVTSDVEAGRAFYSSLFGWESEEPDPDFGGYVGFTLDGVRLAGAMGGQPAQQDRWMVYLATADIEVSAQTLTAAGGQLQAGPHPVGELGIMAVGTDPAGTPIGLWQPGAHQGFGKVAEAGAPCWFQLATTEFPTVIEFYRQLTGGQLMVTDDSPQMRQVLVAIQGQPAAGIMDATASAFPAGHPAGWTVVFGAGDVDGQVARVAESGGSVLRPPADSPYGRLAVVADPQGAAFSLVSAGSEGRS